MSAIELNNANRIRKVDIVMCLDVSSRMAPIIEELKTIALSFRRKFVDEMEWQDPPKAVGQLRVKVIVFRGYGAGSESITESKFFVLDEEVEEFQTFMNGIEVTEDGDGPKNSLAALALAMQSNWVQTGSFCRHAIMIYTDTSALPLSVCAEQPGYPVDMPKNMDELKKIWDEKMVKQAKRMLIFAPECEPWSGIADWLNTFHAAPHAGYDGDIDISSCFNWLALCV